MGNAGDVALFTSERRSSRRKARNQGQSAEARAREELKLRREEEQKQAKQAERREQAKGLGAPEPTRRRGETGVSAASTLLTGGLGDITRPATARRLLLG